jgi:hypothetical protein
MILFLSVALVVLFVFVLLYGFVIGDKDGFKMEGWMKYLLTGVILIAVVVAVFQSTNYNLDIINLLFKQDWSNTFWTNAFFIVIFAAVVAWVLNSAKGK